MKRRDFYKGTIEIIKEGCEALQRIESEIASVRDKINSGRYAQKTINELEEKINSLNRQLEKEMSERVGTLSEHISIMRTSLDEEMSLRGSDITADAELLKFNLSEKELMSLMNRNENNPTMVQLILKNAKERGIDLGVHFVGNENLINALAEVEYAATVVFNNCNQTEFLDTLFGEGSEFETMFNVIDPSPAVTFAYSDERIANAVRVLSDNKCLSSEIQKDIIHEFENHPAVLSILRNAAVNGRNFDAVDMVDSLLKDENNNNSEK